MGGSSPLSRRLTATALLAAALAGGCGSDRPSAAVVGDSLTADATQEIEATVEPPVDIDGVPGATIEASLARIQLVARRRPEVVIVALGTNDGFFGAPDPGGAARQALDALDEVSCVRWIGVAAVHDEPALVNVPIAEAVASHDNAAFVNWAEVAAGHPGWFQPDGIHHTERGQRAFADAIDEAVEDCRRQLDED